MHDGSLCEKHTLEVMHLKYRRLLFPGIACLLLGFIINIALAWLAIYLLLPNSSGTQLRGLSPTRFCQISLLPRGWPPPRINFEYHYWGFDFAQSEFDIETDRMSKSVGILSTYCAGWPTRTVEGWAHWDSESNLGAVRHFIIDLSIAKKVAHFPYLPVWPGIFYNSLIFGGIVFAIWNLIKGVRRWLSRKSTNTCRACGYDRSGLTSNSRCPECGLNPQYAAADGVIEPAVRLYHARATNIAKARSQPMSNHGAPSPSGGVGWARVRVQRERP